MQRILPYGLHVATLLVVSCATIHPDDHQESAAPAVRTLAELVSTFETVQQSRPVDLEGTVTFWDRNWQVAYLQDGDHGMHIKVDWSRHPIEKDARPGRRIRVQGVAEPGAWVIDRARVTLLADKQVVDPLTVSIHALGPWEHGARLVEAEGEVRTVVQFVESNSALLMVRDSDTDFLAYSPRYDPARFAALPGTRVRIQGVVGAHQDEKHKPIYVLLFANEIAPVHPADKRVADTQKPVQLTNDRFESIRIDPDNTAGEPVRFDGQVSWRLLRAALHVEDGLMNVNVPLPVTEYFPIGSHVEVIGQVKASGHGVFLNPRSIRIHGTSRLPAPPVMSAAEIVARQHAGRVQVEGQVERRQLVNGRPEFVLIDNDVRYRVVVRETGEANAAPDFSGARTVSARGICKHSNASAADKPEFTLHATSFDDIAVTSRYFPMSAGSVTTAAGCLLAVVAFGLIWVNALRFQVARRTADVQTTAAHLASSFESVREGILLVDADHNIAASNARLTELLGLDAPDGSPASEFVDEFLRTHAPGGEFRNVWRKMASSPLSPENIEFSIVTSSGRSFDIYTAPVKDEQGIITGRNWTFDDVTDKRKLQDGLVQSQKMEAMGRLAGGVAHDFNNLVTGIRGNLQLARMKQSAPESDRLECIEAAEEAAERAAGVVARLRSFSRESDLSLRVASVNETVTKALQLIRNSFPQEAEVGLALHDDPWMTCFDESRIEQVVLNLCINACDALPSSGGRIDLVTDNHTEADGSQWVRISVADTGGGIADAVRDRIFEPFFTTKPHEHGTGLGLSLSYGIVEQHRGRIECESQVGTGSRFDILLPRVEPDVGADTAVQGTDSVPDADASNPSEQENAIA